MLKTLSSLSLPVAALSAALGLAGCVNDNTSPQEKQLISAGFVRHPPILRLAAQSCNSCRNTFS